MARAKKPSTDAGKREKALSWRSSKWFIQLAVGMAVFTDIFLYALIVPVMPFALQSRTDLKEDESQYFDSWVSILIAVYGGALAVASPICGWAADHSTNRRIPLLAGLIALAGATVLLQVGPNIGILVLGRILQGVSAAVVWVVGLALLVDTVPRAEVGQAMGYVFLAMSLGVLVGPLFGGFIFEKAGYDAVYAMAYGFIGVDIVMRILMLEPKPQEILDNKKLQTRSRSASESSVDLEMKTGTEKIEHATTEVTIDPKEAEEFPSRGKPSKKVPAIFILLRSRRLLSCLWGVMITAILGSQFDSVLPIHVRDTFNWGSTAAGLIFLPITLTAFLSPAVGLGVDKYGPRWFATAGFVTLAPFEILLSLVIRNTIGQKVLLCFLLAMIGISFDLTITPLLVEITAVVEAKETASPGIFGKKGAMAQAYGLFNFAWACGSLVGPIWAGFLNERSGWKAMTWSLALLSIVSAIPVAIWIGGSWFDPDKRRRIRKPHGEEADA
ncbi:MFS general substrate transporter [Microthyrium microscopicum]|uniref:MFS general substrate transporter n=1 Tax=Microthyrium microscopicum TaxID=703497 RepID=A0A6A6UG53_9PEZI|nr:MFS general substrate transporter [Microthyrium microscopicum]